MVRVRPSRNAELSAYVRRTKLGGSGGCDGEEPGTAARGPPVPTMGGAPAPSGRNGGRGAAERGGPRSVGGCGVGATLGRAGEERHPTDGHSARSERTEPEGCASGAAGSPPQPVRSGPAGAERGSRITERLRTTTPPFPPTSRSRGRSPWPRSAAGPRPARWPWCRAASAARPGETRRRCPRSRPGAEHAVTAAAGPRGGGWWGRAGAAHRVQVVPRAQDEMQNRVQLLAPHHLCGGRAVSAVGTRPSAPTAAAHAPSAASARIWMEARSALSRGENSSCSTISSRRCA